MSTITISFAVRESKARTSGEAPILKCPQKFRKKTFGGISDTVPNICRVG